MDPVQRITTMIEPTLADMGYVLIRVRLSGTVRPALQIMAERASDGRMTVEDCAEISHTVSALLDVEDPIKSAYRLEVSSPGIDRPLTREQDFERFTGYEARIELRQMIGQRRKFRGRIEGLHDGVVRLTTGDGEVSIPFSEIQQAKLVLTDDLIAASTAQADGAKA